jgi:hypothetical protein
LQLDFSEAARRQRNLRNSRTRDFRSSASGMEICVGMKKTNSVHREPQRRRARFSDVWGAQAASQ